MNLILTVKLSSNYTYGNNLYSIGQDIDLRKKILQKDFSVATEWFYENLMVLTLLRTGRAKKARPPSSSFSPVTFTNKGISPRNFDF